MTTYKLMPEVCTLLGMTPAAFNSWLSRHERYKAKARTPNGEMLWTDEEIAAIQAARATQPPNVSKRNTARRSAVGSAGG